MGWSISFHRAVVVDTQTHKGESGIFATLIFRDDDGAECAIYTPHIAAAIAAADAFNAEVSRSKAAQEKPKPVLEWGDYFGGSGRAVVSDGHYFVTMICGHWLARKFDGQSEVWRGDFHANAEAAQAACEVHYLASSAQEAAE